jgi:hypothetical protein
MAYTTINKHTDYFNTKLYTGNGGTNAITGVGHQPDWVWTKRRDATGDHALYDAVRGVSKMLNSNSSNTQSNVSGVTSFDSDGFTLGSGGDSNGNSESYVSWNWRASGTTGSTNNDGSVASTVSANTTAGFSIVKWTGTGSAVTVGHGLGQKPDIFFVKRYTESSNWTVYTDVIDGTNDYVALNQTTAKGDSSNPVATTSVFQKSDTNGESVIAYCFASKTGYSKIGSYVGNGNADGTFVYTGFKPSFLIMKRTDSTGNWLLYDDKRDVDNPTTQFIAPNLSNAEQTLGTTNPITDFLSNGFKLRGSGGDGNASGGTIIYMAFGQSLVGSNNVPCTAR